MDCHDDRELYAEIDGKEVSAFINYPRYANSIHVTEGCISCHWDVDPDDLDFSGLCYDQRRDYFWIISDQGKRWFLYDWNSNQVIQSAKLSYQKKGKDREIKKAEGVAIAPHTQRLYIVSDEEVKLYVFEIREDQ